MIERALTSLWDRAGKGDIAALKTEVSELAARRLTRSQKLRLAEIANDAFMGDMAYRLLYRYAGGEAKASSAERLQYGRALTQLDLLTEAREVLRSVNAKTDPMVHLALAFLYSRQWDYAAMVPALKAGVAHPLVQGRNRLLHLYLLANALFTADHERKEPERLLREALREARDQGLWDVEVQATQVLIAHHLWDHEWKLARRWLERYEQLFRDQPTGRFELTREKWWCVLEMHTAKDQSQALREMRELKSKFARAGLFSQVRNCEYYQAMCYGDAALAARLFFGSPLPFFKERVLRDCKLKQEDLPAHYDLALGAERRGVAAATIVLDAASGLSSSSAEGLKPGQAPHRLLQALLADFYVPANIYELCARVYPEEFFNPVTSPPRIAQLLFRLRQWLSENGVPLEIDEIGGRYHLRASSPLLIRVHAPWAKPSHVDALSPEIRDQLRALREKHGAGEFSASELERAARVSRSTALNTLRALVAVGEVVKSGAGSRTRYRLAPRKGSA